MQRIFKFCDIEIISQTPDKEPNILRYRTPSFVIIHTSYALLKMVGVLVPRVYCIVIGEK